jgi:hypothetical protein
MDDVVVLAKTRWQLRRAVRTLNQVFTPLGLEHHPDKTFIGRIERGLDFLGYHFSRAPLRVAATTMENMRQRCHRFYEQQRRDPLGADALGDYLRRWLSWVEGGVGVVIVGGVSSDLVKDAGEAMVEWVLSHKSKT